MSRVMRLLVVGAFAATGLGAALAIRQWWAPDRAGLVEEIERERRALDEATRARDDGERRRREIDAFVARTLGGDAEGVDHRLRTRLNRLAESAGVAGVSVGTGAAVDRRSPARSAFPRSEAWRSLRDEIDFVEVDAWVSGSGPLPVILRLADAIDAEPWIKRIDGLRLEPRSDGALFAVTLRLTTLFLRGREPGDLTPPPYDPARLDRFARLLAHDPFRLPVPQASAPPAAVAEAPPEVPAWQPWRITGIAQGRGGAEVWLRHDESGQTRSLLVGEGFENAVLLGAAAEWAEFSIGEERFRVPLGGNLGDRLPTSE